MTAPPLLFITGASSGIGQALAVRYARAGWRLALVARRTDEVAAWARAQGLAPELWAVYRADLRDIDSIVAAGRRCLAEQGLPDVVVASAGISVDADVFDYVVNGLHKIDQVPLLPCHPRDLLSIAADRAAYEGHTHQINRDSMAWAWKNYFVLSRKRTDAWHSPANGGGIKS